jgi:hypothetical protein
MMQLFPRSNSIQNSMADLGALGLDHLKRLA